MISQEWFVINKQAMQSLSLWDYADTNKLIVTYRLAIAMSCDAIGWTYDMRKIWMAEAEAGWGLKEEQHYLLYFLLYMPI